MLTHLQTGIVRVQLLLHQTAGESRVRRGSCWFMPTRCGPNDRISFSKSPRLVMHFGELVGNSSLRLGFIKTGGPFIKQTNKHGPILKKKKHSVGFMFTFFFTRMNCGR